MTIFSSQNKVRVTVTLVIISIAVGFVYSQGKTEASFFQTCIDSHRAPCFEKCNKASPAKDDLPTGFSEHQEGSPSWLYDYWSTKILGYKVMRKRQYTPCQDRCIQEGHIKCTNENWNKGGTKTFPLFGRMPMLRVGIVEEFASMFFCFVSVIAYSFLYRRYERETEPNRRLKESLGSPSVQLREESYPFRGLFKLYYIMWMITFSCATLFHIKDTPLTERLDYYSAFLVIIYTAYICQLRVFWVTKWTSRFLYAIPYIAYTCYHLYYMQFVSFDYGYNMKVVIGLGVINGVVWMGWCYFTRLPHMSKNIAAQTVMGLLSCFELFDFAPLGGYVDAHAIWHACIIIVATLYTNFLVADAKYYQERKEETKNQ